MNKGFSLFKVFGIPLLGAVFLSATLFAAEEPAPGVKGMSDEEFTPAKEVLEVKYVQMDKPYHMDVESLKGSFNGAKPVNITLQKQDKAFPNGGGSVTGAEVKAVHDGITVYFQITWKDPTRNARTIAVQEFRDAVALMFPLGAVEITPAEHFSPRMGTEKNQRTSGTGRPIGRQIYWLKVNWKT